MEKPASNDYPIHELLRRRWSPRAFADRMVPDDKLRSLFEAARWTASSFNEQPWRFLVATRVQEKEFQRLLGCLNEGNRKWAKAAPVLGLSVMKTTFSRNDRPNRVALHDVGAAMASLTLQATELSLFVHQLAGIDRDHCREEFGIPDDFEPVAAFAVGYPGDPDSLPEKLREREMAPRSRRPLPETVFTGEWEQPAPIFSNGA